MWVICGGTWYLTLTAIVHGARRMFSRGVVRQRLEALSGVALVGFGVRLALGSRWCRFSRRVGTVKEPSRLSQASLNPSMIRSPATHGHGRIDLLP